MNREPLVALDGSTLVNGVTSDVHDTTESARSDGNENGGASVSGGLSTGKTLSTYLILDNSSDYKCRLFLTVHGNAADDVLTQVLLYTPLDPSYFVLLNYDRTATSRTSLLPLLVVSRALRMEGSWSESNFTISIVSNLFHIRAVVFWLSVCPV